MQGTQKIIWLVDERHITRLLKSGLERAGYQVREFTDHDQIVDALRKPEQPEIPHMILGETVLLHGSRDFYQMKQRIQAQPDMPEIMFFALTRKGQDAEVFRGWQAGVVCYMTKPFNVLEVVSFVDRAFEAWSS